MRQQRVRSATESNNGLIAAAGAGALFIGVFLPIVTLPIVGSVNYFQNGRGDGVIILVLAVVAFIMIARQALGVVIWPGVGSLLLLLFTFFNLTSRLSEARGEAMRNLDDNPFSALAEAMIESAQIEWGWAVLILGAVALIIVGIREKGSE